MVLPTGRQSGELSSTIQRNMFSGLNWQTQFLLRDPTLYPVESPLPKERLPPEPPIVLEDAEIRWGKASQFNYGQRQGPNIKYSVRVKDGTEDEDEEKEEVKTLTYTEVEGLRKTSKIRVTSSTDNEVWVDVDRIDEIVFNGPASLTDPTSTNFKYVLKHPAGTAAPA